MSAAARFDAAYFRRWYRDSRFRVLSPAGRARKVRLALAVAEALLERRVRSVLDVGCGEGAWQPVLSRERPAVRYLGLDPSDWAVRRFGRTRNIRAGSLQALPSLRLASGWDLVVCCDVLHYVPDSEVASGVAELSRLASGVAYLECFTADDDLVGDLEGFLPRPARWYRRAFRQAGLVPLGMHCWASPGLAPRTSALERAEKG